MSALDHSLAITGVALAIPPLASTCLVLGKSIIQLLKDYQNSDFIAYELSLKIQAKWRNLEEILNNLHRVSANINIDLESEIRPILVKLSEVLIKVREKAAKMGMISMPASENIISKLAQESDAFLLPTQGTSRPLAEAVYDRKPRAPVIIWSKKDLQDLLNQCEEWEGLISSRILILLMFESSVFKGIGPQQKWEGPIARLRDSNPHSNNISSAQIFPNWSDEVTKISLEKEDYINIQLKRSTIRYIKRKRLDGSSYLVESRQFSFLLNESTDSKRFKRFRETLCGTARMLSGAVPYLMNILKCPGISCDDTNKGHFELLYTIPPNLGEPRSLRDLLMDNAAREKDGTLIVSLSHRMCLAKSIALAVLYVHSGHFVHKHIKPENIIVFNATNGDEFPNAAVFSRV